VTAPAPAAGAVHTRVDPDPVQVPSEAEDVATATAEEATAEEATAEEAAAVDAALVMVMKVVEAMQELLAAATRLTEETAATEIEEEATETLAGETAAPLELTVDFVPSTATAVKLENP